MDVLPPLTTLLSHDWLADTTDQLVSTWQQIELNLRQWVFVADQLTLPNG